MLTILFSHLYQVYTLYFLFFFNDTATTEIYTLSLHDALPISTCAGALLQINICNNQLIDSSIAVDSNIKAAYRSEEHTSELQSHVNLVCRLLLEKKKKT